MKNETHLKNCKLLNPECLFSYMPLTTHEFSAEHGSKTSITIHSTFSFSDIYATYKSSLEWISLSAL